MGRARRLLAVAIATPFVVGACHGDRQKDDASMPDAKMVARDTTRRLGPGDIRIVTESGNIELALIGDSIVTGLGPELLDKVRDKTDTNNSGNGIGSGIAKMVKSTVADAMSQQLLYPLASIKDVRYENGKLQFYYKDGTNLKIFDNSHDGGKPVSESFRPEDAQRFVDAVHARMASKG